VPPHAENEPLRAGRRERNKAENRAAILAAARRVFVELGFEAATIRDVIGATDLASGTFYNYFRDKESVLRALLDEKMIEMKARASLARRTASTVEEVVQRTLDVAFAMIVEDHEVFELLRRNAGAIRAVLDEPGFIQNRDELARDLAKALRRSGATGVDPVFLAASISGLSFELAAAAAGRGSAAIEAARSFAGTLLLGGISGLTSRRAGKAQAVARPQPGKASRKLPQKPAAPAARTARSRTR
jgi:AcrR family transcriptional regulator